MTNKIRKEQIDNGENILFKNQGSVNVGADNIETTGDVIARSTIVDDEAYDSSWDGSLEVPTKNAVYDKLETILVSGDVASVNGATGIVVLDTDDISEGATNKYFSDELAQDAVGAMVNSTLVYTDATPALGRAAITGDVTISAGSNTSAIASNVIVNADISASAAIDASKIANGTISSTEFQYLNGVTSAIQTQLDAKVADTGDETVAGVKTFSSIPVLPASDPTTANQAVRKGYVDVIAASVDPSLYKNSCEVATTANISLSGEQTIDTFATSATRVLVWKQTAPAENGIYISNSGAWTRASDYNTAGEVLQGTSAFVVDGSANKNRLFVMNAASITTIGTDPITFTPLSGAAEYIAGDGIDITANTISVVGGADLVTHTGTLVDNAIPMFNGTAGVVDSTNFLVGTNGNGNPIIYIGDNTLVLADNESGIKSNGVSITVSSETTGEAKTVSQYVDIYDGGTYSYNKSVSSSQEGVDPEDYIGSSLEILALPDFEYIRSFGKDGDGSFSSEKVSGAVHKFSAGTNVTLYGVNLSTDNLTADRNIEYPDKSGTISVNPEVDIQVFTSDGTWTKPAGAKSVHVQLIGAGGGGGSGRKGAVGTARAGGRGGGGGGWGEITFPASIIGSTVSVSVGVGGTGGSSVTVNTTNGNAGTSGGRTSFGGLFGVAGGSGGGGGQSGSTGGGGAGANGFPAIAQYFSGTAGANEVTAGGAGASSLGSFLAPTGGASGGGINTSNTAFAGAKAGSVGSTSSSGYSTVISGGTAGAINGNAGNGGNAPTNSAIGGSGGGGGGASVSTNAGNGGNGGSYGAGGGGGGASTNSVGNSGAGGNGADGIAIITTYF